MKNQLILLYKTEVAPQTYYFVFGSQQPLSFEPGQLLTFKIDQETRRPYSIVSCGERPEFVEGLEVDPDLNISSYISFLISTKSGGNASQFFQKAQVGTELEAIGPTGSFRLVENSNAKVFVATGTGLGPFIPMVTKVLEDNPLQEVNVFFAVWNKEGDFAKSFFERFDPIIFPNLKVYTVIDQFLAQQLDQTNLGGRVTTVIPQTLSNLEKYDFYLCGHPAMVTSMEEVLEGLGVENIYKEKYG
jgi:all-trans-retinol 13,14-reductase